MTQIPSVHIILGSSSSHRRKVLSTHHFDSIHVSNVTTSNPDIDEKAIRNENYAEMAMEISRRKADAIVHKIIMNLAQDIVNNMQNDNNPVYEPENGLKIGHEFSHEDRHENELLQNDQVHQMDQVHYILVTGDQVATFKGVLHEKPLNENQAKAWLESYIVEDSPVQLLSAISVQNITPLVQYLRQRPSNAKSNDLDCSDILKACKRITDYDTTFVNYPEQSLDGVDKILKKKICMSCCGAITIEDPSLKVEITGERNAVFGLPTTLMEKMLLNVI